MPLFRKPKEEGLKPLSEKDIQQRLYGFFHQERSIQAVNPGRKVNKSMDLRSVEVTPAGIIQSDLFRSENHAPTLNEENVNAPSTRELIGAEQRLSGPRIYERERGTSTRNNGSDFRADEDNADVEGISDSQVIIKKSIRKPARKAKKEKKRFDAIKNFSNLVFEKLIISSKFVFAGISHAFSAFVLWLGESRGESRRIPAKFVLISLAAIGTGLIFFNLWTSHLKTATIMEVPVSDSSSEKNSPKNRTATKVVYVTSDVVSKAQNPEVPSAVVPKKYFSIQVCVAQSQQGASNIVRKLKAVGLPAFYDVGSSKRGGKIYKIMLGKFETYQSARTQLDSYRKIKVMEPYQDSFIRNLTV